MIVVKKCNEIEMKTISSNCILEVVGLKVKIEKDTPVIYHLQLSHDIECIFSFKIITDSVLAFSICIVNA